MKFIALIDMDVAGTHYAAGDVIDSTPDELVAVIQRGLVQCVEDDEDADEPEKATAKAKKKG